MNLDENLDMFPRVAPPSLAYIADICLTRNTQTSQRALASLVLASG